MAYVSRTMTDVGGGSTSSQPTFNYYTTDGTKTLSEIARSNSSSVQSILNYNSETTNREVLNQYSTSSQKLPKDITIKIPLGTSGGLSYEGTKYNTTSQQGSGSGGSSLGGGGFNCFMYVLIDGSPQGAWNLPVYPNEFSDSNSASFSAQSLLGRSVDYQIYQGSGRDVSFTLQLHEELSSNYDYIHQLVAQFESACYPEYAGGIVKVPEIYINIGSHFSCRGILTSCSAAWKAPIIDGRLVNCDLSIGIKETTGPYSRSQVAQMGGKRQ